MDREKVIKGFELFIKEFELFIKEIHPVCTGEGVELDMFRNVLALLKEQEAELSFREAKAITHTATKLDDATCPSCGNVIRVRYDYCHYCGQKLDWEGR